MDEILMALIKDDKNILLRRDELIGKLDEKVPANLRRDYAAIRKALKLNVGEILAAGNSDKKSARYKAIKVLSSSGFNEQQINFVIKIFSRVLDWDENSNAQTDSLIERVENLESSLANIRAENEQLKAQMTTLKFRSIKRITKLESEVAVLNKNLKVLTNLVRTFEEKISTATESNLNKPTQTVIANRNFKAFQYAPLENSTAKTSTQTSKADDLSVVVKEYNELLSLSGITKILSSRFFVEKFAVKSFRCTNADARSNSLSSPPPPIFALKSEDINSTLGSEYWATLNKNRCAVLPNVVNYTYGRHAALAMGEVFNSDFKGDTRQILAVESPAIFDYINGKWKLTARGKLILK